MSLNAICSRFTHRTVMKRISMSSEKAILSKELHKNVICWAENSKGVMKWSVSCRFNYVVRAFQETISHLFFLIFYGKSHSDWQNLIKWSPNSSNRGVLYSNSEYKSLRPLRKPNYSAVLFCFCQLGPCSWTNDSRFYLRMVFRLQPSFSFLKISVPILFIWKFWKKAAEKIFPEKDLPGK